MPIAFKVRWLPNVFDAIFYGDYVYYDFNISSLSEFLNTVYGTGYFVLSLLSIIFILAPFQLIKDYYFRKGIALSFIKRTSILTSIVLSIILCAGLFLNVWAIPWYDNYIYLVFALGFAVFFTTLLYFLIDRYEGSEHWDKDELDTESDYSSDKSE